MIKRRYFRQDHGDKSGSSSSSSSSSGSDSDREPAEEAVADEEVLEEQEEEQEAGGEESGEEKELEELEPQVQEEISDDDEHSSTKDEDQEISLPVKKSSGGNADSAKSAANRDDAVDEDFANCILQCKSVYKCKLCPRIMCLNEEMVRVHLKSKRHSRSKKLLEEGRLKLMLNSDGELEEEQETHAERHARTIALAQVFALFKSFYFLLTNVFSEVDVIQYVIWTFNFFHACELFQQVQKPKKDLGRQRQNRRKKRSRNHQEKKQEAQDKKRCKTKG
uniref:Uncharacterized protein n=1 Tax=Arundo donax TaxID=35708 RepID=A0A0A9EMZ7_ARUDO